MFMALPLVPPSKVLECMNHIKTQVDRIDITVEDGRMLKHKFQKMIVYMENQWINGKVFSMEHWSAYMQFVRTNNHIEGDHSRLNKRCHQKKQSLDPLIKILHNESKYIETTISKLHAGRLQPSSLNAKTAKRNGQLTAIWESYHSDPAFDVILMLEAIASNLLIPSEWLMTYLADPDAPTDNPDGNEDITATDMVESNHYELVEDDISELLEDISTERPAPSEQVAVVKKWLEELSISHLEELIDKNLPYLKRVLRNEEENERHTIYVNGGPEARSNTPHEIFVPFTYEQLEKVHSIFRKHFLDYLNNKEIDGKQYLWMVLVPTFLIKIVMDQENISQEDAELLFHKIAQPQRTN